MNEAFGLLDLAHKVLQAEGNGFRACRHDRSLLALCPACHIITCVKCTGPVCQCDNDE